MTPALYHPVLDCFMRVLPHAYRDVAAPPGAVVEMHVDGDAGGAWRLIRAADRWMLTAEADAAPTARGLDSRGRGLAVLHQRAGARRGARLVAIEGDRALAAPALRAVAIVG